MARSPRPVRRLVPTAAALVAVSVLVVAGCSSGSSGTGASDTSTNVTAAPETSVTTATSAPTTSPTDPVPTSPSTLPTFDGPCAVLAQTLGLDEIRPIDSSSWVDERQRVVVDAQREAQLLAAAQTGAPADIAVRLATMQAYAAFVATSVEASGSYAEAVASLAGYPDSPGTTLAVNVVAAWRSANCPT